MALEAEVEINWAWEIGAGQRNVVLRAVQRAAGTDGLPKPLAVKVTLSPEEFAPELYLHREGLVEAARAPIILGAFELADGNFPDSAMSGLRHGERPPGTGWHCLVMERLGADLSRKPLKLRGQESDIRHLAREMLSALDTVHKHRVAHCDVKPANICQSEAAGGWRLIDWGSAIGLCNRNGDSGQEPKSAVSYRSPEMLAGRSWNCPTDIWSLGVCLVELFIGRQLIFGVGTPRDVLNDVRRCLENWELGPFGSLPPLLSDLVRQMLHMDASQRPTAAEALRHPWFLSTPLEVERWAVLGATSDVSLRACPVGACVGELAARGAWAAAAKQIQRLELLPAEPGLYDMLGAAYEAAVCALAMAGRTRDACAWLARMEARAVCPPSVRAYSALALTFARRGRIGSVEALLWRLQLWGGAIRADDTLHRALLTSCANARPRQPRRTERLVLQLVSERGFQLDKPLRRVLGFAVGRERLTALLARLDSCTPAQGAVTGMAIGAGALGVALVASDRAGRGQARPAINGTRAALAPLVDQQDEGSDISGGGVIEVDDPRWVE